MANSIRGAGDAGGHGGDARTRAVQGHHRELEALVLLAEEVLGVDLGVVERHGRRVRRPLAHLVLLLVDDDRVVTTDEEGRDAAVAGVRVGLGVDRVPVGVRAVGDEALLAVEDVLVALLDGARAHRRDVGAGARLGEAEGGELRLGGQLAEELGLDLVGAAEADRRGGEAVGAERGLDAGAAPGQLLLDDAAVEVAQPRPAVLLGHVGVHETDLVGLLDDLLRPGAVLVELPRDRADLLLREVVGQLAQGLLLVGQREVDHVFSQVRFEGD